MNTSGPRFGIALVLSAASGFACDRTVSGPASGSAPVAVSGLTPATPPRAAARTPSRAFKVHTFRGRVPPSPAASEFRESDNQPGLQSIVEAPAQAARTLGYRGGAVMHGAVHVHIVWYGSWDEQAVGLVRQFVGTLGASSYFASAYGYSDATGFAKVTLIPGSESRDNYSRGKALVDDDIGGIVLDATSAGKLPMDATAIYVVFTSDDVAEQESAGSDPAISGFGRGTNPYCGWHTSTKSAAGDDVKFAFVGNPSRVSMCIPPENSTTSPNGQVPADALLSTLAHEIVETVTDPHLDAWVNPDEQEDADLCAWDFGVERTLTGGARANVHMGDHDYLLQRQWVNDGGYCTVASLESAVTSIARGRASPSQFGTGRAAVGMVRQRCSVLFGVASGFAAFPGEWVTSADSGDLRCKIAGPALQHNGDALAMVTGQIRL